MSYEFKIPAEAEEELKKRTSNFEIKFEDTQFNDKNNSPYAPNTRYNYKINISHPAINPYYEDFKKTLKESILSDQQRYDFEYLVLRELSRLDIRESDFPEPKQKEPVKKYYGR